MRTVTWEGNVRVIRERFVPLSELNEEAQERAWQEHWLINDYPWSKENRDSLEAFCDLFGVRVTEWSYGGSRCYINYRVPDWDLYSLTGVRLWKYLINNGYADQIKNVCPLTGYCMDEALLDPIREFLRCPSKDVTMEDLVDEALQAWVTDCDKDYEDYFSFERFKEEAEDMGWLFSEDGNEVEYGRG